MAKEYFTGLKVGEKSVRLPSSVLKKNNIVNTMRFQIENPLDKGKFNDILSKEFNRR